MADDTKTRVAAGEDWDEEIAPTLIQITPDAPFYWGVYRGAEDVVFADGKPGKRHFFDNPDGEGEVIIGTTQLNTVLSRADLGDACLLYTSPSPRDRTRSRMPSSA